MIFRVEITETLQRTVEIEAVDENSAYLEVKHLYQNAVIVLDSNCYIDTDFSVID